MKRTLLAGIIGIAATTNVCAQGHVAFSNYIVPPYEQVRWGLFGFPGGNSALRDTNVVLQLWYALGAGVDPNLLLPGATFTVDPAFLFDPGLGYGRGGYYGPFIQVLPAAGQDFTFQIRASVPLYPFLWGQSVLWTEPGTNIVSIALSANFATRSPGLVLIPEPTAFALVCLGAVSLLVCRRRR